MKRKFVGKGIVDDKKKLSKIANAVSAIFKRSEFIK